MTDKNQKSLKQIHRKYASQSLLLGVLAKRVGTFIRSMRKPYPLKSRFDIDIEPIFIIGSGRTGTTLLRSMLVASGQISIPPETQNIHSLANKFLAYHGLNWDDLSRLVLADFESHHNFFMWEINLAPLYQTIIDLPKENRSLAKIIDSIYMYYTAQKFPEAKPWGDQSRIYTYHIPHILNVFPNARFVHILRDGRDVVASMVERNGGGYLEEAVYRWKKSIQLIEAYKGGLLKNRIIEFRYEDLVNDPEHVLRNLTNQIDLNFSTLMLDYWKLPSTVEHKHKSFHKNLSKPIFSSSVGRWKNRLTNAQIEYVEKNLRLELEATNYL